MRKTCILVLGMHRSGTSALTGTLELLGVSLGNNLMKADEGNAKGYFENNSFYNVNEKLLSQINSSWEDVFFDESKLADIKNTDELKKILESEFKESNLFAIKDPRLAYLFPVYEKVLTNLNINIKIIIPYRNPVEVAASLAKRNDFTTEKGMLLWAYHILLAEKFSRKYDRVFIEFNELLSNPENAIQQMSEKLRIDFYAKYIKKEKELKTFLEPGLKHHNISIDELSADIPKIIKDILTLRNDFNKNDINHQFNTLRVELFSYQKLFYNQNVINTFKEFIQIKKDLKRLTNEIELLKQSDRRKDQQIQEKDQQIQEKDQQIQEKDQQIQEKDQQIQEKDQYIQHLHELVQSLRLKNRLKRIVPKKVREVLHISKHTLKHPVKLFKIMDRQYANKLIKHVKQGNFSYILERLSHYVNHEISTMHLDLMTEYNTKDILSFPIVTHPKVSIIIPVYNQFDYTHRCLRSILKFTDNIDYEIIIADDVSSDVTQNIHECVKNIKVVRNEKNLGFLLNCNNAAKDAKGEYIFFLNNDTNVQEGWLSTLIETIENDSTIGMVGSKLVYPDGRQQEAGGIIWDDASGWNYGRLDNPEKPEYNYVKEVDYISGAAIMIRTELWKEIGGFDKRYVPAYYEDVDLAFEVRKHGLKVIMQPKSVVVHFEGISNGTDTNSGMKKYQVINQEKFYEKWKNILETEHFTHGENTFLARDRSKNKKSMLFIDHYVPHFDQDAGSKATLHYLKLFKNNNINIKFMGDNFYNYPDTPYVTTLEQMGIEVLYGSYYYKNWESWLKENGKYLDYIILSRPHISEKYIDIVREYSNAKIIYFAVDLHYLREEREYQITQDKHILESSKYWKKLELDLMKKTDITCSYSQVEVDEISKEDSSINAIQVPLYIYDTFKEVHYSHEKRNGVLFVGGFIHPPNIDAVKWFVEDIMPKIRDKGLPLTFYIVGSNVPDEILKYSNDYEDIIIKGRVSDEELNKLYHTCRLAVAPLRFGAGMKGKVVESLYEGIPLITTSVGVEGLENINNDIIKIADNAHDFANALIEVYSDEDLSKKLSHNSTIYCKKYFSINCAKDRIFKDGIDILN